LPRDRTGDLVNSGEVTPGEVAFGVSNTLVETGLPFARTYDPQAELERIRAIYRAEAAGQRAPRQPTAKFHFRSLRRFS
jgi:hypothetical protein